MIFWIVFSLNNLNFLHFIASKCNLQVKEDKHKGIFIHNATEVYVNTPEEMKKIMKLGRDNRSVACTGMNERSSRSHSIFILSI